MVAVLAMSATGASAHEFEFSSAGLLLVKAHGPQLFKFPAGEIVCASLAGHGAFTALKFKTLTLTVQYKSCTSALGTVTEPINAEYNFNAEGWVDIVKPIKVIVTAAGLKCEVAVPAQHSLKTITYTNISPEILLAANASSILSTGTGVLCTYATDKTGIYTGSALVKLENGGVIKWT